MKLKFATILSILASYTFTSIAQDNSSVQAYINKYKDLAMQEQIRTGIPASIKLAQGILETASGKSELSVNANNHFGIKCKATWTGMTYTYTDDRKDECFRKYESDIASYKDHSDFLAKNPRYASLFKYAVDDYSSWAHGLKSAGYATNPLYAKKLIELIEKYELHQYTYLAKNNPNTKSEIIVAANNTANTTIDVPVRYVTTTNETTKVSQHQNQDNNSSNKEYYVTTKLNNLKGFWAPKGVMLLDYATKNKVRYAKLLEYNEIPDAPLEADMFIYLEKKHLKGIDQKTTKVAEGETLLQVSQRTGIQIEQLRSLNKMVVGVEPKPGSILYLQEVAPQAPDVYIPNKTNTTVSKVGQNAGNDNNAYIIRNKIENVTTNASVVNQNIQGTTAQEEALNSKVVYKNDNVVSTTQNVEKTNTQQKVEEQQQTNSKELSPYERLKKHMESQVNNKESYYNNNNQTSTVSTSNEEYVTQAARNTTKSVTTTVKETKSNTATTKTTANTKAKASTTKYHTVKKGDTLAALASKYKVSVKELQTWNKVTPKTLKPGQKLKVSK